MKQWLEDEIHCSWQINDIWLEKIEILLGGLRHTRHMNEIRVWEWVSVDDECKIVAFRRRRNGHSSCIVCA